ncbi:D-glycerate dehydrogenase [Halobacillus sp. Marseille-Q1614]|uniref:2-hydroxyacid dehydrogenase n=1 Tax=Halobacillus sp. Marseille-Q1614 TaxID=2709134 RepID=UPI00156E193A|nr:D-glycerate dehydrogenase [Halobacillus sp. Marseille-Q1614]
MNKPYVYITRKLPEDQIKPFTNEWDIGMWESETEPVDEETLRKEAQRADGLLTMLTERIDEDLLSDAPHLKVVANMAVGYDNVNVEAAKQKGITVTNTPDVLTDTTADLAFGLLMAATRRIVEAADYIKENKWNNWSPLLLAGSDIHHKKLGIVGMGRIGEAVARRARGFDMEVSYHNRSRKPAIEEEGLAAYESFEDLISSSDFVMSLVPLTEETEHLFNEEVFRKMKEEAIFVNASRGKTTDEKALYKAVKSGEIKGAGLDVFEEEPIASDHPLLTLKEIVCVPHIGSASRETREKMMNLSLENIEKVLKGDEPVTPVTQP